MRRPLTTWMLGGLLALAGTSWAQGVPPAGEDRNRGTSGDTTVTTTQTTSEVVLAPPVSVDNTTSTDPAG